TASQQSSYQLSSLLSGKESALKGESTFLQEREGFTLNPLLSVLEEDVKNLDPKGFGLTDLFSQWPLAQVEAARLEVKKLQTKAINLAAILIGMEGWANEDELSQIAQVQNTLQTNAERLISMQLRLDYASKKGEQKHAISLPVVDQAGTSGEKVSELSSSHNNLSNLSPADSFPTLSDGGSVVSPTPSYSHMDTTSLQPSHQTSPLVLGKESTLKGETTFLQEGEGFTLNLLLSVLQENVNNLHPTGVNHADLFYQLPWGQFEAARLEVKKLLTKAVNLAAILIGMEDWANGDEALLGETAQVKETLETKANHLANMELRLDYISKKREKEQNLSSDQTEAFLGETVADDATGHSTPIPSAALVSEDTVADDATSHSTPIPSVSSKGNSRFGQFSTHLATLKGLFEENSARLGVLGEGSLKD
ncbi:MAG: hypothetical protein JNJ47_07815, partial [Alphaproteobacteria bacterium]|nr:hypothetical protein [Alphaproteobacteria bacterium]